MIDRQKGRYYTQADVAHEFGVHFSVVRRWVKSGLAKAEREHYTDRGCIKSVMWFTEYEVDRLWTECKVEELIIQNMARIRPAHAAKIIGCGVNLVLRLVKKGALKGWRTPHRDKRALYLDLYQVQEFAKEWKTRRMERKNYTHLRLNDRSKSLPESLETSNITLML